MSPTAISLKFIPKEPLNIGVRCVGHLDVSLGIMIGPYFQLVSADGTTYKCSALVLCPGDPPDIVFEVEAKQSRETLFVELYDGNAAYRYNIEFAVEPGNGDVMVAWTLQDEKGTLCVPRSEQRWRGGFFSCNGFDYTVPDQTKNSLTFGHVWEHLGSVHTKSPLHVLIWGGDQIYADRILFDVKWLKEWINFEYDKKWSIEMDEATLAEVARYYYDTYLDTYNRPEVRLALQNIPGLQQWDDHDSFDGAQSYPDEIRESPVMQGLFGLAQKFRLLFQHHTTAEKARGHGLFGNKGYNFVTQLGPRVVALGTDGRTERTMRTVQDVETWDMIFKRLQEMPDTVQHLLCIIPIPFSYIRMRPAEKLFDFLKNRSQAFRNIPGIKSTNSVFGLPELYDDLLDEWTHEAHIKERDTQLARFQDLAKTRHVRVTFLSGDVHCAAVSRFRTDSAPCPLNDYRLMYQIIASAIVNQSPPAKACIAYHYLPTKWHPLSSTDEELVEMFERRPEGGKRVRHRKIMPNRNWCYFEEVGAGGSMGNSTAPAQRLQTKHVHQLSWFRNNDAFDRKNGYPSTLGPTSSSKGLGDSGKPIHEHHHGIFCHHRASKHLHRHGLGKHAKESDHDDHNVQDELRNGLLLRIWLESREKDVHDGRHMASYEVVTPDLQM